jgi:hypothetical protein
VSTTLTLHLVECETAIAQANPIVDRADYPDAGEHRCIYYLESKPDKARLETYVEVPQ